MITALVSAALFADAPRGVDLWQLARSNARYLRISTLIAADQVIRHLSDEAGTARAIGWCKDHGITRVYIESYRDRVEPSEDVLRHARDRFLAAGLLVSGCITPTRLGKKSTGWSAVSCYTDPAARRELERLFRKAAGIFDEVMIDDFLFTDCQCKLCVQARGPRSWAEYRCDLMLDVSRKEILGAARAVNPRCVLILKYPCWHEDFQERGYDVVRQTEIFPKIWVGTETRGGVPRSGWVAEPQYRAYWLMRWLGGVGGSKCGGGWYDWIGTSPPYYLEQARLTILGGAKEALLFNFGALMEDRLGRQDIAAWRTELPQHFELARLIAGRKPRGLLGWKPPSSPARSDRNLHSLLGMAGFPVIAAHRFTRSAPGFVFGEQVQADPEWRKALDAALRSGRPVLISSGQAAAARVSGSNILQLPPNTDPNRYERLANMPRSELDALRDRATAGLGLSFHAPYGVALWLFGADTAVMANFRDETSSCSLKVNGWKGLRSVLSLPAGSMTARSDGDAITLEMPPRSMVVLRTGR